MQTDIRPGTAVLFPGMGPSDFSEVARFMLVNRHARELTAIADHVLGYSLLDRCRDEPGDYSEYAQVAFLVNCLALARWAEESLGLAPEVCTGPSFGEKPAAVYSGALDVADAVVMTARWARLLADYFAGAHADLVTQSFARVPADRLEEVLAELGGWHEVSCRVDDDLAMVTLPESALERLQGLLRAAGGLPLYLMRPPLHCSVLGPLRDRAAREVLADLDFADPAVPVLADQDGALVTTGAGVRELLLDSFVRPVRWPAVVQALRDRGVHTLYVAGQDGLFGRAPGTRRAFEVIHVNPRRATRPRRRGTAA